MSKYRLLLLLVTLSALFTFSGCSSKDDDPEDDGEEVITDPVGGDDEPIEKKYLDGTAIDGYLDGSMVEYCGQKSASIRGKFSFEYNSECTDSIVVSGGTDMATGEIFSGVIKAPAPTDANQLSVVVTPLTTLITSLVESGMSVEDAKKSVADSLELSEELFDYDPIVGLTDGKATASIGNFSKKDFASAIKSGISVHSIGRTISSAVSNKSLGYSSAMSAFAKSLNSGKKFNEVLDSPEAITEEASKSFDPDDAKRVTAVVEVVKSIISVTKSIDIVELQANPSESLTLQSKSLEVITGKYEELVIENIANAGVSGGEVVINIEEITQFSKAVTMLGGLQGIQSSIEKSGDVNRVDASDFSNAFLTDENIETQSSTYDVLLKNNISIDEIREIGLRIADAELNDTASASDFVVEVIGEDRANSIEDLDEVATKLVDSEQVKSDSLESAKDTLNSAPEFRGTISDLTLTVGIPVDVDYSGHFVDADNEPLTYSMSCKIAGVYLSEGVLLGTPTEATKAESIIPCKIEATDGKRIAKSNPFKVKIQGDEAVIDPEDNTTVAPDENTTVAPDENTTVAPDENTTVTPDENTTVTPDENTTVVNPAPTLATAIGDISGTLNVSITPVDVSSNFSDTDDNLTYTLSTCNGLTITGSTISGTPLMIGATECTVTATDTASQSVSDKFNLTVTAPISAPAKISDVSDIVLSEGVTYSKSFSSYFSGTISSYAISCSSAVSTVGLSLSGSTLSGTPNSDVSLNNCRVSAQNSSGVAYTNYFDIISGGSAGASATVASDNNITVGSIEVNSSVESNSSVTDGVFTTITKGKLSGSSFSDIKDQLAEIYNLKVTIENSSALSDVNEKNITLGALIHDTNRTGVDSRFVLVGIPALMTKSGDSLRVEVEADSTVTMFGRDLSSNSIVFSAELTNDGANIRTGTATSGEKTWTVNLERVFNAFADDNDVGSYIESIIHNTATNSGSYDVYIFLSNSAFEGSDAIAFTNDKEDIDLNSLTGISSGSTADTTIDSLFGASSDLKGFKGTLVLQ